MVNVLAVNDDLPIRTERPVHSGKVRSVYWLSDGDSRRLIEQKGYDLPVDTPLAVMVISDRISAFDCIWHGEGGLQGIPGKGAALNAIANHWFARFRQESLADSHIVDIPHPLVWIVQKAKPVMLEAICRQYITGSMWRSYARGERSFCGIRLPEGLQRDSQLSEVLVTPSTKGILKDIPGVPEADDVNVSHQSISDNYRAFKFEQREDIQRYQHLLLAGFRLISKDLAELGQIFVDTKFEFGYVKSASGESKLIYMDEVGTPDSSRIWDAEAYAKGKVVENSKEGFRQGLLSFFSDPDILLNKDRMIERQALARDTALPEGMMMALSDNYRDIAEAITGKPVVLNEHPREEIIERLQERYGLIR